jgi:hypothetical protein
MIGIGAVQNDTFAIYPTTYMSLEGYQYTQTLAIDPKENAIKPLNSIAIKIP